MIAPDTIIQIAQAIEQEGLSEHSVAGLRTHYPDIHFTYCMDDDVGGLVQPYLQTPGFNIYLVDGREHCLKLTGELEAAGGLVLAEVIDDE
ncbi:MAG: hypothetical protein EPN21_13785 [Methylococcaceae bacterium]|nr:MAG: hypothetical protein EPN21_13785 [Methylococcaceae bacterium]